MVVACGLVLLQRSPGRSRSTHAVIFVHGYDGLTVQLGAVLNFCEIFRW